MDDSFLIKYKPYFIEDFNFDSTNENAFRTFLRMNDLNILLYGSSNCGKTMLLECLVRMYYELEKHQSFPYDNIIYINNLKEQGIQFYRNEMKTFCQTKSSIKNKKKMIIIDDIDNINEQSQQVFRTYIDNYKHNVHFTMVCTNMQKVIESIQSRLHIIQLKPLSLEKIHHFVNTIAQQEKLCIGEDVKQYIISICNNSVRTVINHLEKLYMLNEPITLELCKNVCSNISIHHFEDYIDAYKEKNLHKGIQILNNIYNCGYSVIDILDYFFFFVKITNKLDENTKYKIIPYICKYITIFHNLHEDMIELSLFTNNLYYDIL